MSAASAAPVPDEGKMTTGPREFRSAVIDGREVHRPEHLVRNVRGPGNLQEVAACANRHGWLPLTGESTKYSGLPLGEET